MKSRGFGSAALAGLLCVFSTPWAFAATVSGNLSSTQATVASTSAATIRVGSTAMSVHQGQMLTPAEMLAVSQVLSSGKQSLVLGSGGNAVGGTVNLSALQGAQLSSLTIPQHVSVLDNTAISQLSLTGNLTNGGVLYLYSNSPSTTVANITAANITNQSGALLSSLLPAGLLSSQGGIAGLSLNLNAINNLINAGTITSAGALSLTAGNAITNSGTMSAAGAAGNVNLVSNQINNSGLISSAAANININSPSVGNISVNNINGTLQALLGNINVRDASFASNADFNLTGGNLLSQALNIYSGTGIVNVAADKLTGLVNVNAYSASVEAQTSDLELGTMNLAGDPTFFNPTGAITITTPLSFSGVNLAIVASGDILTGSGAGAIDTSYSNLSTAGNGGSITLIAGAKFTPTTGGIGSTINPGNFGDGDLGSTTLTITGGSSTGGKIDLFNVAAKTATPITSLDSSSNNGSGGDITLIAFKGLEASSGSIVLPNGALTGGTAHSFVINASGTAASVNANNSTKTADGNVTMIAGGTLAGPTLTGFAVLSPDIAASSAGGAGANNITLASATPTLVGTVTVNDGALSGGFAPGTIQNGGIAVVSNFPSTTAPVGDVLTGNFAVSAKNNVFLEDVNAPSGTINITGFIVEGLNANNATGTLTSGSNITISGNSASLGNVSCGGALSVTTTGNIDFDGPVTAAGNVTASSTSGGIVFGGSVTAAGNITASSASGGIIYKGNVVSSGGQVNFTTHGAGSIEGLNQNLGQITTNATAGFLLGAVVNAAGTEVYVPDFDNNKISVINTATNAVTPFTLGDGVSHPQGMTLNSSGTLLFIACADGSSGITGGHVLILNASNGTVVGLVQLANDDNPQSLALSPNGNTLYVVSVNSGAGFSTGAQSWLTPINVSTPGTPILGSAQKIGSATSQSGGIVINPQGTLLFVSASVSKTVETFSIPSATPLFPNLIGTVSLSGTEFLKEMPIFLAMDPNGTRVYVADGFTNNPTATTPSAAFVQGSIVVIDANQFSSTFDKVLANVALPQGKDGAGTFPQGISTNPTGTELFAQATYFSEVSDVYTATNQVIENPFTGTDPTGKLGTAPDGFGSNDFTAIVSFNGVPESTVYTSNTFNLQNTPPTVTVLAKPTIQCSAGHAITLTSGGGTIIANFDTQGGDFSANTTGSGAVVVNDVGSAGATILASSAPSNIFEIGSVGNLNVAGAIKSSNIILQTTGSASITINSTVGQTGATVAINTGSGSILQDVSGQVVGSTVTLSSVSGSIGTVAHNDNFVIAATPQTTLQLSGAGRGTFVLDSLKDNGTTIPTANYSFDSSTGIVTFLTEPSSGDSIVAISQTPFDTTTSKLNILVGGDVQLHNTGAVTLAAVEPDQNTATGVFNLAATGSITLPTGVSIMTPNVTLESGGSLVLNGQVGLSSALGNVIQLFTDSSGSISQGAGTYQIIGDTLDLETGINGGSGAAIGSSITPLRTTVNTIVEVSGTTSYIANTKSAIGTGALALNGAVLLGSTLQVTSTGDINVTGGFFEDIALGTATITLKTIANNGGITIDENMVADNIILSANGSGAIECTSNGLLTTSNLTLTSGTGEIGNSGNPILTTDLVATTHVTASTQGPNIYIAGNGQLQSDNTTFQPYILSINPSSVGNAGSGTFSATVTTDQSFPSNIIVAGAITAHTVDLTVGNGTDTADGAILLQANVGISGQGSTTIQVNDPTEAIVGPKGATQTIPGTSIIRSGGSILSNNVTLQTTYGNIGTSTAPITITSPFGTPSNLTVIGGNGVVPIGDTGLPSAFVSATGAMNVAANSSAGVKLQIIDAGTLTATSGVTITAPTVVLQTTLNGSINLNGATVTAATSALVAANGSGSITGAVVSSLLTTLTSGTGNIGTSGTPVQVGGGTITATTGGNGSVYLDPTTVESIGKSASGTVNTKVAGTGLFVVENGTNALTIVGALTGGQIQISNGSDVTIGASIGTSTSTVAIVSTGDIIFDAPSPTTTFVSGTQVVLSAAGGLGIGAGGTNEYVQTKANTLAASAPDGNVFVLNSGVPVTISTINTTVAGVASSFSNTAASDSSYWLISSTPIVIGSSGSTSPTIQANQVILTANGAGSITEASVVPVGQVTLEGTGSNSVLTLTSGSGSFGSSTKFLSTDFGEVDPSTTGQAYINNENTGTTNFALFGFHGSLLNMQASGDMTVENAINSPNITLSSGGSLTLNNNVGVAIGTTSLSAAGNVTQFSATSRVLGSTVQLADNGTIGSAGNPFETAASNLLLSSIVSPIDAYIANTGAVTVKAAPGTITITATTLQLSANGSITVSSNLDAGNLTMSTTFNNGNIIVNGVALGEAVGTTSLTAFGSGSVSTVGTGGTILGATITLSSTSGNLGTSAAPLKLSTNSLSAFTGGSGTVVMNNSVTSGGLALQSSSSGGAFSLTDSSTTGLTLEAGGVLTSNGNLNTGTTSNITLVETGASADININCNVEAGGGGIVIQNKNNISGNTITIGDGTDQAILLTDVGVHTATTVGTITIAIGAIPTLTTALNLSGVTGISVTNPVSPGNVLRGNNTGANPAPVTGPGTGTATVFADGRNIIFSSPASGSISLANNSTVQADPPAIEAVSALQVIRSSYVPSQVPILQSVVSQHSSSATNAPTAQASVVSATPVYEVLPFNVAGPVRTSTSGSAGWGQADETVVEIAPTLIAPDHDLIVDTPVGALNVAHGAIVLIMVESGSVSVFDLHDGHTGDVQLEIGGKKISLAPGRHITVARETVSNFADVNPCGGIAHRGLKSSRVGGSTVFASQFSIPSAISSVSQLEALVHGNHRVADEMLRDAAILMQINSTSVPYQRFGSKRAASKLALN